MAENDQKRRVGVMLITTKLMHDILKLPETVKIVVVGTGVTWAEDYVGIRLEGDPMPLVAKNDEFPKIRAEYGHDHDGTPVLDYFEVWNAKRDTWMKLVPEPDAHE